MKVKIEIFLSEGWFKAQGWKITDENIEQKIKKWFSEGWMQSIHATNVEVIK